MKKEDCPHLCEVISSGEKVKACRQDKYTVNTYFSCENCKRDKKADEFAGTSNLDDIKKDNMTVKELIEKLQKMNPDAIVLGHCGEGSDDFVAEINRVEKYDSPNLISREDFTREEGKEYIELYSAL